MSVSLTKLRGVVISYRRYKNTVFSLLPREISCWKCGSSHKNGSHCISCNAIQEPAKLNYFELLGMDISYDIDIKSLVPRYHNLQILFHPDKHSTDDAESKKKSDEFSTAVNKAYSTLTDPINRGLYILKLNGIHIDETTTGQNPELLTLILEYNEEISKIKQSEDARRIMQNVEKELWKLSSVISECFKKKDYKTARDIVIQMTYHAKILKSLKAKIQEMGLDL